MSLQPADDIAIKPVGLRDTWRVGQILCRGLAASNAGDYFGLERWLNCALLPLALPFVRHGFRAARQGRIAGCAYVDWRRCSGYVFNVAVDGQFRRQGVATALMRFLEGEARRRGCGWLGLYVDWENVAARRLYQEEGYHAHAAQILRRSDPTRLPEPVGAVDLQSLSYRQGRRLMEAYRKGELRAEGEWAGEVVGRDYPASLPAGSRFRHVYFQGVAVGVACSHHTRRERTTIQLWLDPAWWGEQDVVLGVIHALSPGRRVEVDVSSEEHLQALQRVLLPLGFAPVFRSRLLMLKKVE